LSDSVQAWGDIEDPDAQFPTIAVKHGSTALSLAFSTSGGGVNARGEAEFFNPPVPGKKIFVTGRIVDKYIRRDKPYLVIEAEAKDEDGRLIERTRTYQMRKPDEVGKKWGNVTIYMTPSTAYWSMSI